MALGHHTQHHIDRRSADPGLDAKPAAGHQAPQQGGDVGPRGAKRRTQQHRKGHPVLGAGVPHQGHGDEHDHIAQHHRQHRLPPRHALVDEAGGQGIGGHTHHHAHPEGGDAGPAPGATRRGGGGEIGVVEPGIGARDRLGGDGGSRHGKTSRRRAGGSVGGRYGRMRQRARIPCACRVNGGEGWAPLLHCLSKRTESCLFLPLRRLRRAQRVPGASPSVAGSWGFAGRWRSSRTESRSERGGLAGLNLMLTSQSFGAGGCRRQSQGRKSKLPATWRSTERRGLPPFFHSFGKCPEAAGPWRLPEAEPGEKVKASGHLAKYGKKGAPPLLSLIRQVPGSRGAPGGCRRQSQGRKSKLPATWRSTERRGLPPFFHSFGKCPEALLLLACIVEDQRVRW
jgi:hypothetical protein